ncbi:MAG TPA: asparaginase [Thermoanaerobaculia bacterium]|nr:asparaginase [Thermoanaerobaculia bacterium]
MRQSAVLAAVFRGESVESLHRGDVAVVAEGGELLAWSGDPRRPVYLRSAAKPFQATVLLAGGGERFFGLSGDEIAVACASHGGTPRHVRTVERLLGRGGFTSANLVCGAHLPMDDASARALLESGRAPTALHNNCSGKHAGILLACRMAGWDPAGYWKPEHPIERQILECVARFCRIPAPRIGVAVDGCGLPVFRLPLSGLALGYARLMARAVDGETAGERSARRRVRRAMSESPEMVAGRRRFTTDFLRAGRGRWIGKEGAEGVYAIGLAAEGGGGSVGIAFKIEDGSTRARDAVTLAVLSALGRLPAAAARRLSAYRTPEVTNAAGWVVGGIRPALTLATGDNRGVRPRARRTARQR